MVVDALVSQTMKQSRQVHHRLLVNWSEGLGSTKWHISVSCMVCWCVQCGVSVSAVVCGSVHGGGP